MVGSSGTVDAELVNAQVDGPLTLDGWPSVEAVVGQWVR
jgi:hypothetical protein